MVLFEPLLQDGKPESENPVEQALCERSASKSNVIEYPPLTVLFVVNFKPRIQIWA